MKKVAYSMSGDRILTVTVIDNAYLSDFYRDMARYSFPLQIYLLNTRFRQHQQIIWQGCDALFRNTHFS